MTDLDEKIISLFPSIIASVQESIRIPSLQSAPSPGAPFGAEISRTLEHALRTASLLGLKTQNVDGYVGWAEYGDGVDMVGVLGHLDVVPPGEGWNYPSFGAEIHEDKLYGRGALDDKGPSIGALWLLYAIKELKLPIRHRIRVLLGTNEESGMQDMPYYLKKGGEIPLLGFTPDGDFPIVASEKGQLHICLERVFDNCCLTSFSGGTVPNVVPSESEASLLCSSEEEARKIKENLESVALKKEAKLFVEQQGNLLSLKAFGVSAHGSMPHLGKNAALLLWELISLSVDEPWSREINELLSSFSEDTGGKHLGIALRDEPSGELSCNLGILKFDGRKLSLILDIRYPVSFEENDVLAPLNSFAKKNSCTMNVLRRKNPLWMPADSLLIKKLQKIYKTKTGLDPKLLSMGGGTYAKALPHTVAFGPKFPDSPDVVHKANEFIDMEEFLLVLQIMGAAMVELAM